MSQWASNLLDTILPGRGLGGPAQRFSAELVYGFGAIGLVATGAFCLTELAWGTPMLGVICAVMWFHSLSSGFGMAANARAIMLFALLFPDRATNFTTGGQPRLQLAFHDRLFAV